MPFFHIAQVCQCSDWFKAVLVNKIVCFWLFLAIQNDTHVTNRAVFFVCGAVFSEECCMEIIALLFV